MRTSRLGWRVVAIGVFFLILGFSLVANNTGPTWVGVAMLLVGVVVAFAGRQV